MGSGVPPPPRYRLHHVLISAPAGSEEQARAFFVNVLGMTEVAKPANLAVRGGIWLDFGDTQLHIGVEDPFRPAEKSHPAFEVDDVEAVRARLTARGIETWEDERYPGRRRFYTRDPFGNRLEFLSTRNGRW
jgi:catechol 2,3-dioxygenase-like lactoylglutathione lyase family enzyme